MKRIIFAALAVITIVACKTEDKKMKDSPLSPQQKEAAMKDSSNFTSILWLDSTTIDIGKVKRGATVEVSFRFKNSGNKPLIIEKVEPGCGCTATENVEGAIAPGGEDAIKVKFNSTNQGIGTHAKPVYVYVNTSSSPATLTFNVEVVE
jgi:hypothetical protein